MLRGVLFSVIFNSFSLSSKAIFMEKSEEVVSVCNRISESTVTLNENVAGETLEESLDCASQSQIEGLVGEDAGGCSGKDVMVEVLGSDVYIDGVCTRKNEAEFNDEEACGGSTEMDKDVKPSSGNIGANNVAEARFGDSQVVQSSEAKSESFTGQPEGAVVDREEALMGTLKDHNAKRPEAAVRTDEIDAANVLRAPVLDNGAEKEVEIGVSNISTAVNSAPEEAEVHTVDNVGLEHINAQEAGVRDEKLTNTSSNALGGLMEVSSLEVENVHSQSVEKDNQQQRNWTDHGTTEGVNDVTFKSLDEQKKIANGEGDQLLEKACIHHEDESVKTNATDKKLNSVEEQPMDIDKFGEISASPLIDRAEVSLDKNLLNSDKKCFGLENDKEKKMIPDTSQASSSDTGQGMEVDKHFNAEDNILLGQEQNFENNKLFGASSNIDAQVCNVGEVSLTNREEAVNFNNEDMGGDFALVGSGSTKQVKLNENVSLCKRKEEEVEDQSSRIKRESHNADIQGKLSGPVTC